MEPNLIPSPDMKKIFPGTTDQTWNVHRHKGTGPKYAKFGRKIFYRADDIRSWVDSNMYERPDRPVRGDVA